MTSILFLSDKSIKVEGNLLNGQFWKTTLFRKSNLLYIQNGILSIGLLLHLSLWAFGIWSHSVFIRQLSCLSCSKLQLMLFWMTILRWKEDTSPAHGIICCRNDTGRLSHHPLRMQILITCYATFQHLLPMAHYLNLLSDSESHFYSFVWLLQFPALSHSKYMVIPLSAQVEWFTLSMDFWFDWWTSIGVSTSLIMCYSIWQLLMTESTMWDMLEGPP